jgi:alpha-L-fucosidase
MKVLFAKALPAVTLLCTLLMNPQTLCAQYRNETVEEHNARMAWWRDARFGMFIHWGVYSIPARGEWYMYNQKITIPDYEKFPPQFNPVQFDARQWARLAREAGMRYIVITSKHHDGFCMWDSRVSSYDIIDRTPFKRDPLMELAVACREEGIRLCFYHSIMDWHHPDASGTRFASYRDEYLKPQLEELLTQYGPLGVLWFDGEWISEWTEQDGKDLYDYVRSLQPGIIVNNRVGKGRNGMAGLSRDPDAAGDFGTPEQEIPPTGIDGVDWESCMTMNDNWGYAANDSNWKSTKVLVRNLIDIASKGGNYLLNVGPTQLGTIPDPSTQRLKEIGRWMQRYGESIHGTHASPLAATPWGRCTRKELAAGGQRLYLHVFDWPKDGQLAVSGLGTAPGSARLVGVHEDQLQLMTKGDTILISLPQVAPDTICSVVELDFPGEVVTYHPPVVTFDCPIFLDHATITMKSRSPELEIRYTTDGTAPTIASSLYRQPFQVTKSAVVRARSFHRGKPVSSVTESSVSKVSPEISRAAKERVQGLTYEYFEGNWDSIPAFSRLQPTARGVTNDISLTFRKRPDHFGVVFSGYVSVPSTAVYTFALSSDDGSRLLIDDRMVVDNDGLHGTTERRGYIALEEGVHLISVLYFNKTGEREISLGMGVFGKEPGKISESAFFHLP